MREYHGHKASWEPVSPTRWQWGALLVGNDLPSGVRHCLGKQHEYGSKVETSGGQPMYYSLPTSSDESSPVCTCSTFTNCIHGESQKHQQVLRDMSNYAYPMSVYYHIYLNWHLSWGTSPLKSTPHVIIELHMSVFNAGFYIFSSWDTTD